jgi:hypothetical protein
VGEHGTINLRALVRDAEDRGRPGGTEADVPSSNNVLLLAAPLNLAAANLADQVVLLEAQAGQGRRTDVEMGATVFEVKKDLRIGNGLGEAVQQLAADTSSSAKPTVSATCFVSTRR